MNDEPVAWMELYYGEPNNIAWTDAELRDGGEVYKTVPLYTNPANIITEIIEKNKPEIEKANAYIKSLKDEIKALKAKTLTDEEILQQALFSFGNESENFDDSYWIGFARAILKKASEK